MSDWNEFKASFAQRSNDAERSMSDVKHTPGPWPIERNHRGSSITSIGPIAAEEYAGSAWLEVSEADANIAAAAPDLLEVLMLVEDRFGSHCIDPLPLDLCERITAAIAKARGAA